MSAQVSTPEHDSLSLLEPPALQDRGIYSSLEWNPSEQQMQKFKQREIELAAINIQRLWKKGYKKLAPDDLLCSTTTLGEAFKLLEEKGLSVG